MNWANTKKLILHLWRTYATTSNVVLAIAVLIGVSWGWGTVSTMRTNFAAQNAYEEQRRQLELTQLELATLQYQQNYYESDEYKDLAARTYLGLASPGEKVIILPKNSDEAKQEVSGDIAGSSMPETQAPVPSNFAQWLDFLSGNNARSLQD